MGKKQRPRFENLAALVSALREGGLTDKEFDDALAAVKMGVGLSKRDKALGIALEQTGENKDNPVYWEGFRAGLVEGYEGARTDLEAGVTLRPIAELAAEAQAEEQGDSNHETIRDFQDSTFNGNLAAHDGSAGRD